MCRSVFVATADGAALLETNETDVSGYSGLIEWCGDHEDDSILAATGALAAFTAAIHAVMGISEIQGPTPRILNAMTSAWARKPDFWISKGAPNHHLRNFG